MTTLLVVKSSACLQRYYHLFTEKVIGPVPLSEVAYDCLRAENVVLSYVQRNKGDNPMTTATTQSIQINQEQYSALQDLLQGVLYEGTLHYDDDQESEFNALGAIYDQLVALRQEETSC